MVFRLNLGEISFNLVENAFATRQLAFLATGIAFYDVLTRACAANSFFLRLSFFSFSFLFATVIDLLLGLLAVKKLLQKTSSRRAIFTMEQPGVVTLKKFWSEFFAQLFEHFCAYHRLHLADHSDLDIIG